MDTGTSAMTAEDEVKRKRANIRMALLLAALAAGVLAMFFWSITSPGGSL